MDFSEDFSGYASAASEASGATSRQTQHEAAGSLEQITRFPFLIKTGLCWGWFCEPRRFQKSEKTIGFTRFLATFRS